MVHGELPIWTFAEIAAIEPVRAELLLAAPSSDAIQKSLISRFESEMANGNIRIGMEQSEINPQDLRVVLQFLVGEVLFDQFFNAVTGYRAQFRRGWQKGLSYNRNIVTGLQNSIRSVFPGEIIARLLCPKFKDCGHIRISRAQICASLNPDLSKVWFCGLLISGDGQIVSLPTGTTGPRLRLDQDTTWAALARDESDAWLDVKGAFIGPNGPYQSKDPIERAKNLEISGEA